MKTLLSLLLLIVPMLSFAASPSFNSFIPFWFTNSNSQIGMNTNNVPTLTVTRALDAANTNYPFLSVTNGIWIGNTVLTASSDATNFILAPFPQERFIDMTGDMRVIAASQLAPAGFVGFVGYSITNNSGSTYTFTATNTMIALGTNTLSIATGKAARVVFRIDETRVSWGGTVQP